MLRSYFFVVNPNANSGQNKTIWLKKIFPLVQKKIVHFDWAYTTHKGSGRALTKMACAKGFDVIVAVGGDGTINEVVNGLLEAPPSLKETHLACLNAGTGSDFIKTIGMPKDPSKALNVILHHQGLPCDVGVVECDSCHSPTQRVTRRFINMASFGVSGEIIHKMETNEKRVGRWFDYWFATLCALLRNGHHKVCLFYAQDGGTAHTTSLRALFICNGQYCGGGMRLGPEAKLTDGLFDVTEIKKANLIRTLCALPKLPSGSFQNLSHLVQLKKTTGLKAESASKKPIFVECDGEKVGLLPARFYFDSRKVRVITNKELVDKPTPIRVRFARETLVTERSVCPSYK